MMTISQTIDKVKFNKLLALMRVAPRAGYRRFYRKYSQFILITTRRLCKSEETAHMLASKVGSKIVKTAPTIDYVDNPNAWVYVIIKNVVRDYYRSIKFHEDLDESIPAIYDGIEEFIERESFYSMIKGLSKEEKFIVENRVLWKFTFEELASELNKPPSTVSSTYYRAKEKVQKNIKKNKR